MMAAVARKTPSTCAGMRLWHTIALIPAGAAPTTCCHDQLVTPGRCLADDHGLQHAHVAHAGHELGERLLLEHLPGLTGVRLDRVQRQVGGMRAGLPLVLRRRRRNERSQPATEPPTADVHDELPSVSAAER